MDRGPGTSACLAVGCYLWARTPQNKQMAFNFIDLALDKQNSIYYDVTGTQIAARNDVAALVAIQGTRARCRDVLIVRALHALPPCVLRLPQTVH